WSTLHDTGGEGAHHARVVRFLIENHVEAVVANHMGPGMLHTIERMGLALHLGAVGDAREAVVAALGEASS
ncbi:MAG: dinitrogenase iron-molybdenum cofactor, partial [Actinobacteria bacterium]|nr:dinitrogenase iron-molybdenum cofactor [Actinomycetota bacterium]